MFRKPPARSPHTSVHPFAFMVAIIALLVFFPCELAAQGPTEAHGITGYVRDAGSHEPVVSARVDLMSPNGLAAPTVYTNENGEFHFYIGDGDYQLSVSKIGYEPQSQIAVTVLAGHSSEVEIDLRPRDSGSSSDAAGPPSSISAHELSAPAAARQNYAKGKDLMSKKNYDAAIAAFEQATREFPDFYEAYAQMGVAQYVSGHAVEARASLKKSIDLSKGKYPDALFDLAEVLNDLGKYSDAESLAKQVIALDASSWHGYFESARAFHGLQQYKDAETNAKKAVELAPRNVQTYVILTNIHIRMHDYPSAVHDIDGYLKLDSTSPTADAMRSTRAQLVKAIADAKQKSKSQ
ncbi:MAG TPA: tetratricopeptide repeat protein [Candidatus Acidoferrales bacterium]|nr:tetratricopeptide repeat protein [Candidatus Acidoferrales bacterium]